MLILTIFDFDGNIAVITDPKRAYFKKNAYNAAAAIVEFNFVDYGGTTTCTRKVKNISHYKINSDVGGSDYIKVAWTDFMEKIMHSSSVCVCGKQKAVGTKFCSACGKEF